MAIYRGSRYESTIVYNHVSDGHLLPTLQRNRTIPTLRRRKLEKVVSLEGSMHTWLESDRIDALAHNYYGDASKWWIILDANPKYMTPWDIKPGDILTIPSYQEVRQGVGL